MQAVTMLLGGAAWKFAGLRWAGESLVRGLVAKDETVRTVAGIMLVRAGQRSGPLLERAARDASPESLPMILRILGDMGDARWDAVLEAYTGNRDEEVADAARDAIKAARLARLHG